MSNLLEPLPDKNPLAWAFGSLLAMTTGIAAFVTKRTLSHEVKIAVLETDVKYIRSSVDEIKAHLGVGKEK
jgi:hypothetical protein